MAANLNGIVINEILADPTGGDQEIDVNGDGTVDQADEFVELHNSSSVAVSIAGWTIDDGDGGIHTVAAGTVLQPQAYYRASFDTKLNNSGDEIILTDTAGNSIAAIYNGGHQPGDLAGVADVDDFGNDAPGLSVGRSPDGSDTFATSMATPGAANECFLTGTLILTAKGEVPVEQLRIGDRVKTAEGKLVAIKWIGRQAVDPKQPHHPLRSLPIQIKAGALGSGLPYRDLFVSPDHAVHVHGLLINAGALVNDSSITKTYPKQCFTYFHIELEKHSLLIAEGAYAESYLPQHQSRDTFDNGEEYGELYSDLDISSLIPMELPRVSSCRQLPSSVARYLQEIAKSLPWAEPEDFA